MKNIYKRNSAITIVSLVVTIIILIILAGVSLSLLLGENGILIKAKNSKKAHDIAKLLELLELEKGQIGIENDFKATLKEYIEQIEKNGIINNEDIVDSENIENGKCYIKMEGKYYFLLEQEENNIKITYVEKPLVLKLVITQKSNYIDVIANLYNENLEEINSDEAEYEYTIKEEEKEYKEEVKTSSKEYTYEGLEQNKKYCIKVKAKKDGQEIEVEKWVITGVIGTPTIVIENPDTWSTSKRVTIETEEEYSIKYTLDETIPNETNGKIYDGEFVVNNNNTTITARYFDNTGQMGSVATDTITMIDTVAPETLDIKLTPSKTSIKVDITQATDATSGIAGYRFSKDNGATWTSYQTEKSYTFTNLYGDLAGVKCTIKVETKDNAGNIKQVAQNATTTCLNTTYYKNTANLTLCTILDPEENRTYYKYNNLGAICAVAYRVSQSGNWTDPVLVSTNPDAVKLWSTYSSSIIIGPREGTINYYGATYYYSGGLYSMGSTSVSTNLVVLNTPSTRYSSPYEAAVNLLNRYFQ